MWADAALGSALLQELCFCRGPVCFVVGHRASALLKKGASACDDIIPVPSAQRFLFLHAVVFGCRMVGNASNEGDSAKASNS